MQHLGEPELTCCVPNPHKGFICSSLSMLGLLKTPQCSLWGKISDLQLQWGLLCSIPGFGVCFCLGSAILDFSSLQLQTFTKPLRIHMLLHPWDLLFQPVDADSTQRSTEEMAGLLLPCLEGKTSISLSENTSCAHFTGVRIPTHPKCNSLIHVEIRRVAKRNPHLLRASVFHHQYFTCCSWLFFSLSACSGGSADPCKI